MENNVLSGQTPMHVEKALVNPPPSTCDRVHAIIFVAVNTVSSMFSMDAAGMQVNIGSSSLCHQLHSFQIAVDAMVKATGCHKTLPMYSQAEEMGVWSDPGTDPKLGTIL